MSASRRPLAVRVAVLAIASGCSSSSGEASAPASSASPPTDLPPPPPPAGPSAETGSAPKGPKAAPQTARDCTDLVTDIVNDPPLDGGVAMNNAQTASDAGGSDRLVPIMEAIQKERDAFRCCFDLWGKAHGGEQAKIALELELAPTGKLVKASFKQAETDLKDPAVEACMSEVAGKMSFPPSPSGKDTTYTHRFEFKARTFGR